MVSNRTLIIGLIAVFAVFFFFISGGEDTVNESHSQLKVTQYDIDGNIIQEDSYDLSGKITTQSIAGFEDVIANNIGSFSPLTATVGMQLTIANTGNIPIKASVVDARLEGERLS